MTGTIFAGFMAGAALPLLVLAYLNTLNAANASLWRSYCETVHHPWRLLLTSSLVTACGFWLFSTGTTALGGPLFFYAMVWLAWVDLEVMLLPDCVTLPLLLAGLVLHALIPAVLGAASGYGLLWLANRLFRFAGRDDPLGGGDLKLLAAAGSWLGLTGAGVTLLIASVLAAIINTLLTRSGRLQRGQWVPFGPYLAVGSLVAYLIKFNNLVYMPYHLW